MWIRSHTFRNKDGTRRTYLRLVRSRREGGKVRQEIVGTLGRLDMLQDSGALDRLIAALVDYSNWQREERQPQASTSPPVPDFHPRGGVSVTRPSVSEAKPVHDGQWQLMHWAASGALAPADREKQQLSQEVLSVPDATSANGKTASILRKSPVFSGLTDEQYKDLSRLFVERWIKPLQSIYSEGDLLDRCYVVAEGRIKVFRHSPSGKDFIIAFIGPGAMLGNVAFLSDMPHPSTAQAVVDTQVLAIKNEDLLSFLWSHPEIGFNILRRMLTDVGIRFTISVRRLADLVSQRADHRLAHLLLILSLQFGPALPFTREELGQMAGMTTETATRFVNNLTKKGIVRSARRNIIILKRKELESLVQAQQKT